MIRLELAGARLELLEWDEIRELPGSAGSGWRECRFRNAVGISGCSSPWTDERDGTVHSIAAWRVVLDTARGPRSYWVCDSHARHYLLASHNPTTLEPGKDPRP